MTLRPWAVVWLIFLVADARQLQTLRSPVVGTPNKVQDVTTVCNSTHMDITVVMERPYKGLLAAKDFSQECGAVGTLHNVINLTIPPSGCGVRMTANSSDQRMYYSVNLIAQQDRFLRQVTDQEIVVRCWLKENALTLKSEPMVTALKTEVNTEDIGDNRVGRMRTGWKGKGQKGTVEVSSELSKEIEDMLSTARAWMEISPADNKITSDFVQVGEPTLLSVKSTLPAGIGWRVIECSAHDGTGDSNQRLLDELGCPIDESILPALTFKKAKVMGQKPHITMRHQEAVASFSAFKFPDRDRLHISCGLQLCRGNCIDPDCRARNDTIRRFPRKLQKGERGEILDRLEVFNSVEVLAPGIELDTTDIISDGKSSVLTSIPGDRTFCVSPNKMALSFCVLGIILLIAVVVALWSLLRARRSGHTQPYYTRSIFSSSGSSGSRYGGSKLLLNESPCLGQTRHWRIL